MYQKVTRIIPLLLLCVAGFSQTNPSFKHLASYETKKATAAEVVDYDPLTKRAFYVNGAENSVGILNITNPAQPLLIKSIDLSSYVGFPNSVAVKNGYVAVAIQDTLKTKNGSVVIFNTDGEFIQRIQVGSLPDMLTFNNDGSLILVANEGEPSNDYSVDPVGSISIINTLNWGINTYDFSSYNSKRQYLLNKGIRVFGKNSSVAQDFEPEYISVSPDNKFAYINCQENNAIALFDLTTNTIVDIFPLGYKNHNSGSPTVQSEVLNTKVANWPILGTPVYNGGQAPIKLGGFSGLWYSELESTTDEYVFYTVPDRGPNDEAIAKADVSPAVSQNLRPYKLPNYQGIIVKFKLNNKNGEISVDFPIPLTLGDGVTPITGRGNIAGYDEIPVTYTDPTTAFPNTDFTDKSGKKYHKLEYDPFGGDFEGIVIDKDGNYWMCDENRPSVYKFSTYGSLIDRYVPQGTSLLGSAPKTPGSYGKETLPSVYSKRRENRGFEAIAYDKDKHIIYAFIQSPLENRDTKVNNNSDVIRILAINADTGEPVGEYVYFLERNKEKGFASSRVDKLGDAVFLGNGKFLVIERDSEIPGVTTGKKYVFEIDINNATNILDLPVSSKNGTFENIATINNSVVIHYEEKNPFLMPTGYKQELVLDRNTANKDSNFAATFGSWDIIALDPSNNFIYIPAEVEKGAGLSRFDRTTGDIVTAIKGNATGVYSSDPNTWNLNNDDFGAFDPAEWTPYISVLTAEEWAGNGRLFEWMNPLMAANEMPIVRWRSNIPSVSHEGLKFDAQGNLYFVDEFNSGSIYKFVPKTLNDLSIGQTFVLKVDAYNGVASENFDSNSNKAVPRTGSATWIPVTDANGVKLTTANPFNFTNRGGRLAADELNGTPYGRPEDLEIVGTRLYMAATSENSVYSIDLINSTTATVRVFASPATTDGANNRPSGTDFAKVDNLAKDANNTIYVIEDNEPSDIWMSVDSNNDGVAESVSRILSLATVGAEATGFIATKDSNVFLVCIQHPNSNNDAIWKITIDPTKTLQNSVTIRYEDRNPFMIPSTYKQELVVNRNTADKDADFASTFGSWDIISLDPTNNFIFIPAEVEKGAGLIRYDRTSKDFVTALKGNASGVYSSDPITWNKNNDDYGALDPSEFTSYNTVLTAEEWAGNGRLFEWMNPLMGPTETADVKWRSNIPSVSHEGLKFDAKGTLYFVDESNSGSIYKFVPNTKNDLSVGQSFVLKVETYNGLPNENWDSNSNKAATRTGKAKWLPITDANGIKLTTTNPFDFINRGGRNAADELRGTPYGRPEDLEMHNNSLYFAATSEHSVYSIELNTDSTATVKIFASPTTLDHTNGAVTGPAFARVDNLAKDHNGNIYIIEDNEPSDIWVARDADKNGIAESVGRILSLSTPGAEATGFTATKDPNVFMVCIQHPSSNNDAIWKITTSSTIAIDPSPESITLEEMSSDQVVGLGIRAANKLKVLNLPSSGYAAGDKPEGICVLPNNKIAVINDNDFGLAGAGLSDDCVLGIYSFGNNFSLDPSDRDNKTALINAPILGMYLPDAISSYTANGKTYIVTANEGDSRDYPGYSEEARVKDLKLNPQYFPNAKSIQVDSVLGRLKTTKANGDLNNDGVYEQVFTFGGRSFSIFDQYGNLVYDSGNDFDNICLNREAALYNEDGGKKDQRSDDKGVEPEALAIATIKNRTYAFVGMERQSAIVVYEITDPTNVKFIDFYNNRKYENNVAVGDISPEIIKFIPAASSPNNENLILVAYEVSGSVGIIQIGDLSTKSEEVEKAKFNVSPNPIKRGGLITLSTSVSGVLIDQQGHFITRFDQTTQIPTITIESGIYWIKTQQHGSRPVLILD